MTERALATIRKIDKIEPIANADAIEVATIGGWKVVVKKGEYEAGDLAIYFEIDSWIPHWLAPFLTKSGQKPKTYEGVEGQRLKTIKLRGQISQGLLLPLDTIIGEYVYYEGQDLTKDLGILKWESANVTIGTGNTQAEGSFPTHLVGKTDAERIQNYTKHLNKLLEEETQVIVTEKLDGTSFTATTDGKKVYVCSRNLSLKDSGNVYWDIAKKYKIPDWLEDQAEKGKRYAIQGEIVGPGIQGNSYKLNDQKLFIFSIWDVDNQEYLEFDEVIGISRSFGVELPCSFANVKYLFRKAFSQIRKGNFRKAVDVYLQRNLKPQWEHVPVIQRLKLGQPGFDSVENILKTADGKSVLNKETKREGLVFWGENVKFKAISNSWLLKKGE